MPKSRGGLGLPHNLVLACKPCNNQKADMDVETYRWYLQEQRAAGEKVIFYGERIPQPWYV